MNNENKNRIPVDLIALFLSGEADRDEINRLEEWKILSDTNRALFIRYEKLWNKTGTVFPLDEIDVENEWKHFKTKTVSSPAGTGRPRIITLYTRIAAAIIAGIILGYSSLLIYNDIKFEKVTASVKLAEVILPDGSEITLYPGSYIKYPKKFKSGLRNVSMEGEAYFDVQRDTSSAFYINAGDMVVSVLGTSFNIEAYRKSDNYSVVVESGEVMVFSDRDLEKREFLVKGEKITFYHNSDRMEKSVNNDTNYIAWKTKAIVFRNTDLNEVVSILSKVYNTDIRAEQSISGNKITVTFENRSLDYIIKTIEATLDISMVDKEEYIIFR